MMSIPSVTMKGGIYKIINTVSGKQYVGSAVNLKERKWKHWSALKGGKHDNSYLQRAWNKYSENAFEFRIVGKCRPEDLIRLEQEVMDHLKPEYNLSPTAGSQLGFKHTEETRRKISEAVTGRVVSAETKHKMSEALMGNTNSLGHVTTEETRKKLSKANMGNTNSLGCVPSTETRRKLSVARRRRQIPKEVGRKISKAKMGHVVTEETRQKISRTLKERRSPRRAQT